MNSSATAATILVVDDRESLVELIASIHRRAGFHVLTATSSDEAARFARFHPSTPVLFVSSSTDPIKATEPFEFLAKPFTVDGLRDSVRRARRSLSPPDL